MSFLKPESKNDTIDDAKRLLCTVPGCGKRWSVMIEKPMCSAHQWGKTPATERDIQNYPDNDSEIF